LGEILMAVAARRVAEHDAMPACTDEHVQLAKYVMNSDLSDEQIEDIRGHLHHKFLPDFSFLDPCNQEKLAWMRAEVWLRIYAKNYQADRKKLKDLGDDDIEKIRYHQCPVGMKQHQMMAMFGHIAKCVPKECGPFKIILTGSSTTIWSENPEKKGVSGLHYFDKAGHGDSDFDFALSFGDQDQLRQTIGQPAMGKFGEYWGSSQTVGKFPELKSFYEKWGKHPYIQDLRGQGKKFNRDIGIVILGYSWHNAGTASKFWKRDFVYDPATGKLVVPKFGVLRKPNGGKGKGKGKGKGNA